MGLGWWGDVSFSLKNIFSSGPNIFYITRILKTEIEITQYFVFMVHLAAVSDKVLLPHMNNMDYKISKIKIIRITYEQYIIFCSPNTLTSGVVGWCDGAG